MPHLMNDDRNTPDDRETTGRTVAAGKSSALAERLAAAPRNPRHSLAGFIRENANDLRNSRDEGVSWEDITAAVREQFPSAAQTSVETYVARFAPAKKTRELRRKEMEALPPATPTAASVPVAKELLPTRQTATTGNPFMPRRPPPAGV